MVKIVLIGVNILYIIYIFILSVLFELFFSIYLIIFKLIKKGRMDDAYRIHNWMYGRVLVKGSWPYIRTRVKGLNNIPEKGPFVLVFNHRSYVDIFFASLIPPSNQLVVVRSWIFRLWMFGWAMRLAHYIDIEKISREDFLKAGREYSSRNVSFLFFPEGHRSRDGKLRRFRTGAFLLAAENDLPVIPICIAGTGKFASKHFPYFRPSKIKIDIFPAVLPSSFGSEQRALKIRKYVERLYREYLGE